MLYQDSLTGMLHEVPEGPVYGLGFAEDPYHVGESQIVYDGLGNPVGALPFLAAALPAIGGLVSSALPALSSVIRPAMQAVSSAIPGIGQALSPAMGALGQMLPQLPGAAGRDLSSIARSMIPNIPGLPVPMPGFPTPAPMPAPYRPPWPAGWVRPTLPYTGLGPRRLYMRCAVWPGPKGLVPAIAAQTPAAQAQAAAAAAAQTAAAMQSLGRRRRHGRRRR